MRATHAGTFHVTTRSIAEQRIFRDRTDYRAGVQILADLSAEQFLICHEFCLMPTHYHVLASFEEKMLTAAIRRLNKRYASGFNWRHGRRGHVFDSPFVSVEPLAVEQLRRGVLLRLAGAVGRKARIWFGCAESGSACV